MSKNSISFQESLTSKIPKSNFLIVRRYYIHTNGLIAQDRGGVLSKYRKLTLATIVTTLGFLAVGCSSETYSDSATLSPVNEPSNSSSANATSKPIMASLFDTGSAQSADPFWRANPELMPKNISSAELLFNEKRQGPTSVDLPSIEASESLTLVLTCDSRVPYEVSVVNNINEQTAKTGGKSCGGPNINSYQTPPFKESNEKGSVRITVPAEVEYYITAYRSVN